MIKVNIPTAFRAHTSGDRVVQLSARNIGDLLESLTEQHPQLRTHLLDDEGQLLSFVNVFVNDENIRDLAGDETPLTDSDQVFLVPAMAGG